MRRSFGKRCSLDAKLIPDRDRPEMRNGKSGKGEHGTLSPVKLRVAFFFICAVLKSAVHLSKYGYASVLFAFSLLFDFHDAPVPHTFKS